MTIKWLSWQGSPLKGVRHAANQQQQQKIIIIIKPNRIEIHRSIKFDLERRLNGQHQQPVGIIHFRQQTPGFNDGKKIPTRTKTP